MKQNVGVACRMMTLTDCGHKDCLFDLGCGDGRVLVAAAQRGARAVGYELDSELVSRANAAISNAQVCGVGTAWLACMHDQIACRQLAPDELALSSSLRMHSLDHFL